MKTSRREGAVSPPLTERGGALKLGEPGTVVEGDASANGRRVAGLRTRGSPAVVGGGVPIPGVEVDGAGVVVLGPPRPAVGRVVGIIGPGVPRVGGVVVVAGAGVEVIGAGAAEPVSSRGREGLGVRVIDSAVRSERTLGSTVWPGPTVRGAAAPVNGDGREVTFSPRRLGSMVFGRPAGAAIPLAVDGRLVTSGRLLELPRAPATALEVAGGRCGV